MRRNRVAVIGALVMSSSTAFAQPASLLPLGPAELSCFVGVADWISNLVNVLGGGDLPFVSTTNLL